MSVHNINDCDMEGGDGGQRQKKKYEEGVTGDHTETQGMRGGGGGGAGKGTENHFNHLNHLYFEDDSFRSWPNLPTSPLSMPRQL